jgi:hypothetical protein
MSYSRSQERETSSIPTASLSDERDFVAQWSHDENSFVLLHDLTTCLRIGDATLFKSVGTEWTAPGSLEAVTSGEVGAHGIQEAASR